MSNTLCVFISDQPAPEGWNGDTPLSFGERGATVHRGGAFVSRRIQMAGRRLAASGVKRIKLAGEGWDLEAQWCLVQSLYSAKGMPNVELAGLSDKDAAELQARREVSEWTRELVNSTPEDKSPEVLSQSVANYMQELAPGNISYEIVSGEALAQQGLVGIHGVGRGSDRPPALLILDYKPDNCDDDTPAVALVGKGITFDSGGYSIKSSEGMLGMKGDMGGAATVAGALALAIRRGLNKPVRLFLCCAENLISGHAYKLGDVLKYKNGVSVEVVNTDAEGRLVLADGLLLAGESGAPLIIDAATLTGAAVTAVGSDYNAVFCMDEQLRERYLKWAKEENELHWPLPLEPWHSSYCPSPYADTANSRPVKGGGAGGASNAAGFLARFVPDPQKGWLHLDLAAAMHSNDNALWAAGGTAHGIRTLAKLLTEA